MNLNERQKYILETIINDYIETGLPVSSLQLIQNHDLGVCSATVRNDMLFLTDQDYLHKSYSSSGRIPTSKGYKFFVQGWEGQKKDFLNFIPKETEDIFSFSNELLNTLSDFSSGLLFNYVFDKDILWEKGWENVILEPELKNGQTLNRFINLVDETKEKIQDIAVKSPLNDVEVFIGEENPIIKSDEFSIITCRSKFPKTKQGCAFVLMGPKRMPYRENIDMFKNLLNILEKI